MSTIGIDNRANIRQRLQLRGGHIGNRAVTVQGGQNAGVRLARALGVLGLAAQHVVLEIVDRATVAEFALNLIDKRHSSRIFIDIAVKNFAQRRQCRDHGSGQQSANGDDQEKKYGELKC